MEKESSETRRAYLGYCAAIGASGLLAGCAGSSSSTGSSTSSGSSNEPNSTTAANQTSTVSTVTENATSQTGETTASLEPVGEIALDSAPNSWVSGFGFSADVITALGHADSVVGMAGPSFWYQGFYDELDITVPSSDEITKITSEDWNILQEQVYEVDPDLFAIDPNVFLTYGVSESELTQITNRTAPFLGNASRRERSDSWPNWPDGSQYPYYEIPAFIQAYGNAFGEAERAEALINVYEETISTVTENAPTGPDRPSVGLLNGRYNPENDDGFTVYNPISPVAKTYGKKQYRDLNVNDAFSGIYEGQSSVTVDYETLVEYDPDVIVFNFGVVHRNLEGENLVQPTIDILNENPVAQQTTAVQNDEIYIGGTPYQGPIINLFQTEMLAKQLYPEQFGEWPGFDGDSQPTIPDQEQLFDRTRLAEIAAGDL